MRANTYSKPNGNSQRYDYKKDPKKYPKYLEEHLFYEKEANRPNQKTTFAYDFGDKGIAWAKKEADTWNKAAQEREENGTFRVPTNDFSRQYWGCHLGEAAVAKAFPELTRTDGVIPYDFYKMDVSEDLPPIRYEVKTTTYADPFKILSYYNVNERQFQENHPDYYIFVYHQANTARVWVVGYLPYRKAIGVCQTYDKDDLLPVKFKNYYIKAKEPMRSFPYWTLEDLSRMP